MSCRRTWRKHSACPSQANELPARYASSPVVTFRQPASFGEARRLIGNPGNTIFVSAVSLWEVWLKSSIGKLRVPPGFDRKLAAESFEALPLRAEHTRFVAALEWHHKDPFDRMPIAQATGESSLCSRRTRPWASTAGSCGLSVEGGAANRDLSRRTANNYEHGAWHTARSTRHVNAARVEYAVVNLLQSLQTDPEFSFHQSRISTAYIPQRPNAGELPQGVLQHGKPQQGSCGQPFFHQSCD